MHKGGLEKKQLDYKAQSKLYQKVEVAQLIDESLGHPELFEPLLETTSKRLHSKYDIKVDNITKVKQETVPAKLSRCQKLHEGSATMKTSKDEKSKEEETSDGDNPQRVVMILVIK